MLLQLHPKPTVFWIPPKDFWDIHFLFYLLIIWTCDQGLTFSLLNVVVAMWIEYLSKFTFWELHSHIDKTLLYLNLELVISGQTYSIIFEFYYWVVCDTCDSWNSYFGEFHGTFHILSIIGLNECRFMFFFKKQFTRNNCLNRVFVNFFYDIKHYKKNIYFLLVFATKF
jgi:hypothetical protein